MNIDDMLLRAGNTKPRRALSADFTRQTLNYISEHPRKAWWRNPREILMKSIDKPAMGIAAFIVTLAISGTAYAAVVNWPSISAMFAGEQHTQGGRIVQVDTKNCNANISAFNITKPANERGSNPTRYFKVKQGSKLTNEQITQMVLGDCEQDAQSDMLQQKLKQQPNQDIVGAYADSTITAISASSITLEADMPIGYKLVHVKKTFNKIDPNIAVYYKSDTLHFSDLQVGDHVGMSYRATGNALLHSETLSPEDLDTDEATVVMIIKNTPAATAAINYRKYLGSEFEEVAKCDKNATGFCTLEEYLQN